MRKKIIISLIGASCLSAGAWFAYDHYLRDPVVAAAPECDSCSARHKAYSRAKKSWAKDLKLGEEN